MMDKRVHSCFQKQSWTASLNFVAHKYCSQSQARANEQTLLPKGCAGFNPYITELILISN